jgi:ABC-type oligopeptide transport system, periplasmic component
MRLTTAVVSALLLTVAVGPASSQAGSDRVTVGHGLSMHGDLKYGPGFKHFGYVNPEAPKGGNVKLAAIGTFDTLNPFILKGVPAVGLGEIFDTLTVSSFGRAVLPVRPGRREHRGAGRPFLGGLHAQAGSPLSRRQSHDGRGRHLDLRDAQG